MRAKKYATLYWKYQVKNMKGLLYYRKDFLLQIIFTIFSQSCYIFFVAIICNNTLTIDGWTFDQIFLLYSFLVISEGCTNFFFQGVWKISEMINLADLDRFLVRPVPIGLQILTARIDFEGICKIGIGSLILIASMSNRMIECSARNLITIFFFLIEACIIRVSMIWIASSLSFWMKGGKNSINFLVLSLGEMAKYPISIYPTFLRGIFAYIIPYAFVSYYPVGFLLKKEGMMIGVMITPIICIVMIKIANSILKKGLERYESCGN